MDEVTGQMELDASARSIIDANQYMTLATADSEGRPWACPVWFAHDDYTDFIWVSRPETLHTHNLLARPEVGIVIFDSTRPPSSTQAVYISAQAEELTGQERELGIVAFSRRSQANGLREWRLSDVTGPASHRLYRARALEQSLLQPGDQRVTVSPGDQ
ncbi:pyridoxamine 5'-phosphate oxidase family protein [Spirillospora sp. NPDC048911]|uniref:pyridoxamine 5'-phosphate oxidase family protein n=1 Tax=Spirillospora sp. NPDC048911 TaxID=3364527 RepID=UPI003713209F